MNHVAIIDVLGEHGGMNYYTHGMAAGMADAGITLTVHSPSGPASDQPKYLWRKAFIGAYGRGNRLSRAWKLLSSSVLAAIYNKREKIDFVVFHIFRADALELFDLILAKASGRRIVCIIHDVSRTDRDITKNYMGNVIKLSDHVVVHNEYSLDALCRAVPNAAVKSSIIPHGNYIGQFNQPSMGVAREALNLPPNGHVCLLFGSQRREKGLDILLASIRRFKDREDFTLLVAGKAKPEDETYYRSIAREYGVEHLVRFDFGHISDDVLPNYYRAADMVVLPYLRIYESGVALMAMSFGRPVVVSDIPALAALAAECTGLITFVSEDAADLARRIDEALSGHIDLDVMGKHAFDFAKQERSWSASGLKWAALIRSQQLTTANTAAANNPTRSRNAK